MSDKITQIVDGLKSLTLVEAAELVTSIEQTFGVDASSAAVGVPMAAGNAAGGVAVAHAAAEPCQHVAPPSSSAGALPCWAYCSAAFSGSRACSRW